MRGFELHHRPGYRHLVGQGRPRRGDGTEKTTGKANLSIPIGRTAGSRSTRKRIWTPVSRCCGDWRPPCRTRRPAGDIGCVGQRQPAASGRGGPPPPPPFSTGRTVGWEKKREPFSAGSNAGALYGQTGWPFDYKTFPLAMLCWIKCHRPELLEHVSKVCMSTEYLVYRPDRAGGGSAPRPGSPFYPARPAHR